MDLGNPVVSQDKLPPLRKNRDVLVDFPVLSLTCFTTVRNPMTSNTILQWTAVCVGSDTAIHAEVVLHASWLASFMVVEECINSPELFLVDYRFRRAFDHSSIAQMKGIRKVVKIMNRIDGVGPENSLNGTVRLFGVVWRELRTPPVALWRCLLER